MLTASVRVSPLLGLRAIGFRASGPWATGSGYRFTMRNVGHANNELFNPLFYRCYLWSNAFNNFKSVQNFPKAGSDTPISFTISGWKLYVGLVKVTSNIIVHLYIYANNLLKLNINTMLQL